MLFLERRVHQLTVFSFILKRCLVVLPANDFLFISHMGIKRIVLPYYIQSKNSSSNIS